MMKREGVKAKSKFFPFEGKGAKNLKAFSIAAMLNDTGEEMYSPYLPYFAQTFLGVDPLQYGLIESTAEAVNRLLRPATGLLTDRIGRKRPVVIGYFIIVLSRMLLFLAHTWIHLIPMRMFRQVGRALRNPAREASIAESLPKEMRGKAYGLLETVDTIGSIAGPFLGISVLSLLTFKALRPQAGSFTEMSYRGLFIACALPTIISALVIFAKLKETLGEKANNKDGGPDPFFNGVKAFFSSKSLILFSASNMLLALSVVTVPMLQYYIYTLRGGSVIVGGIAFVLYSVFHFLSAYMAGFLCDTIGRTRAYFLGILLVFVSFVGLALSAGAYWALPFFPLYGIFESLWVASRHSMVADLAPKGAVGQTMGTFSFLYGLALMLSPLFFGTLSKTISFKGAFLTCAILSLLSGSILLFLPREEKK